MMQDADTPGSTPRGYGRPNGGAVFTLSDELEHQDSLVSPSSVDHHRPQVSTVKVSGDTLPLHLSPGPVRAYARPRGRPSILDLDWGQTPYSSAHNSSVLHKAQSPPPVAAMAEPKR